MWGLLLVPAGFLARVHVAVDSSRARANPNWIRLHHPFRAAIQSGEHRVKCTGRNGTGSASLRLIALTIALVAGIAWVQYSTRASVDEGEQRPRAAETRASLGAPTAEPRVVDSREGRALVERSRRVVAAGVDARDEESLVQQYSAALEALIQSGSHDAKDYLAVLRALIEVGTPEAIALVASAMEDESLDFSNRSTSFAELLRGVSHPDIQPAAVRVLDRNIALGLDSWYETDGYVELIAGTGGPVGAQKVLALLDASSPQLAAAAARGISRLADHGIAEQALQAVRGDNLHVGGEVAESLACWKDPEITARLMSISMDTATPASMMLGDRIAEAVGRNLQPAEVQAFAASYWNSTGVDRQQAMSRLAGIARNTALSSEFKRDQLVRMLEDAVVSGDSPTHESACSLIQANGAFHTEEMLAFMQAQLVRESDESRRRELNRTIAGLKRSL